MHIKPSSGLSGVITVPGDKSISHRSIILGALANGTSHITGFLPGADCVSTVRCFEELGIRIQQRDSCVIVYGKGLHGLTEPRHTLYTGNSGTTTRLLTGLLAGQPFTSSIDGDASIRSRPMGHVRMPLVQMGADISGDFCPITIRGRRLKGITYTLPVASAQLKSAILLASLYAEGQTVIHEPESCRDHTERMLQAMGADITVAGCDIVLTASDQLSAMDIAIPADISSAAFFLVAASIVPNSCLTVTNVGINPTRTGILEVLGQMGANLTIENKRLCGCEPVADITVRSSSLKGCVIEGDLIPRLIDEIPIIAVAAAFANGKTIIRNAQQLKVKESNRISAITKELTRAGVAVTETEDGCVIEGGRDVYGASFCSYKDHRMAMSMAVLALAAHGESSIEDPEVVKISFPDFFALLKRVNRAELS